MLDTYVENLLRSAGVITCNLHARFPGITRRLAMLCVLLRR